jgi:hypothetical protein
MSASRRVAVQTLVPSVQIVRAHCCLCREMRSCAALRDDAGDRPTCFECTLSMAQLIAATQRESARPHAHPCTCFDCSTFDGGQRGEIANLSLVDDGPTASQSHQPADPSVGAGGDAADASSDEPSSSLPPSRVVSRWSLLEVDPKS